MASRSLEDELAAFEQEIAGLGGEEEEDASLAAALTNSNALPASQVPSATAHALPPERAPPAAAASFPHPSSAASSSPAPDPASAAPSAVGAAASLKRAREDAGDASSPAAAQSKKPFVISAKHSAIISAQPTPAEKLDLIGSTASASGATATAAPNTALSSASSSSPESASPAAAQPYSAARSALPATAASSSSALPSSYLASSSSSPAAASDDKPGGKRRVDPALVRAAAGSVWVDETLASFPPDDFRIFVGDLGIEVNDALLSKAFAHYASFAMARVVRDKKSALSRGFGFVSFLDHEEGLRALKEMNGRYCGNRPMKLKKGQWQKRSLDAHKKRSRRL